MLQIYKELPQGIRRDFTYDVTVTQGDQSSKIPVYNHTEESACNGRGSGGDHNRRFAMFAFDGTGVRVDIKVKADFGKYAVMPSAKRFKTRFRDGVISVFMDKPDYFLIRMDDDENTILSIFADDIADTSRIPDKNDPDVIWIDGWYETENGLYDLMEDNKTLYLAPGSVFNVRAVLKGNNIKAIGYGAVVADPFNNIYKKDVRVGGTEGKGRKIFTINGSNCTAEGMTTIDARCYNYVVSGDNMVLRNAKALSSMMTTDGVSSYTGDGQLIEHCFLYVGDNALVYSARNTHHKDLTIGTTCCALFPQVEVHSALSEDIHVFRANEGILNHRYNGDATVERIGNFSVKNLDSVDCPTTPWLFQSRQMGTIPKNVVFENVSTNSANGSSNPRYLWSTDLVNFDNKDDGLYTSNYHVTMKNVYVDDMPAMCEEDMGVRRYGNPMPNDELVFENDGTYTPVHRVDISLRYIAPKKIFIGKKQIFFEHEPIWEENETYAPAKTLLEQFNRPATPEIKVIDGVEYVKLSSLVDCGLAKSVSREMRSCIIIPVCDGKNLLLPDSGEISHFYETSNWMVDLITLYEGDKLYYRATSLRSKWAGFARMITREVKAYGEGTYRFNFKARASQIGQIRVCFEHETWKYSNLRRECYDVNEEWRAYSFEFEATHEVTDANSITIGFHSGNELMPEFDICDIELVKL